METRVITGITTSGTPHLGNYAGAIKPAIKFSILPNVKSFFFLADYHALVKCHDKNRVYKSRLELAATWLASGLDPEKVIFYRQSDISEILELSWILTCLTHKGLMNRAHAYKSIVDKNHANGNDNDFNINMGLYSYPILMAADILLFKANLVPVGKDQLQHVEIARDIAQRFNQIYNTNFFVLPKANISENVAVLPGLDGRKMSKSYNNTIKLFEGSSNDLLLSIMRIITDSSKPNEIKDATNSSIYLLYHAFSNEKQSEKFKLELNKGIAWKEAKKMLFELLNFEIEPMRERYKSFISKPKLIEEILQYGSVKAKKIASENLKHIKDIIGLSDFN